MLPVSGPTRANHVVQAYGWVAAVRTPEWNYSGLWNKEKYEGKYPPQLYDRKKDPEELHSVADQHPSVVRGPAGQVGAVHRFRLGNYQRQLQ